MQRIRPSLAGLMLALCTACGGGGGSSIPLPPAQNRVPVLAVAIPRQYLVDEHAFSFDATQGGITFHDPDGDSLTYRMIWSLYPAPGLSISGASIQGVPTEPGAYGVYIDAFDGRDFSENVEFILIVEENADPSIDEANVGYVFPAGTAIDIDATRGGRAFIDANGDALTYDVEIVSPARGLAIQGTRVVGTLGSVGVVQVSVMARDAYGGEEHEEFPVAAPAIEVRRPNLPTPTYSYDDAELELPYIFRLSSANGFPLPDTQPGYNRTSNAGATLGRVLFYDRRLSITNTVSCGSCHQQSAGFTIPDRFGTGVLELPTSRNPMSLGNARYNQENRFFSDHRVQFLENLALMPVASPLELGSPLLMLVEELEAEDFYPPLFEAAFGTREITLNRVSFALAQFVRSLISYQSKFDRAHHSMINEELDPGLLLTPQELRGKEVFGDFGRGGCKICHNSEIQTMMNPANNGLDAQFTDPGAGGGGFRPSSLRNIAVTGPYMHDGRFATLREVIDHYDHGVQDNPNLAGFLRQQLSGPPIRLNLSEEDKLALEAFMNTFTDDEFLVDPKFSDPF